ncbi:MAG: 50S ribosomal protein L4 [Nanoarchaeota archaeon]
MKVQVYSISGEKKKEIELPKVFESPIRIDILSKVLEARKMEQPFAPSPVAGKQHSASGVIKHRRHVWKTSYGRGMSRVPRKAMSIKGTQFNWVAAESPQTRGGRRAHPPKIIARMNTKKINKKENKIAFESALSATANEKYVQGKYSSLKDVKIGKVPFVLENTGKVKVKEFVNGLKKILGETLSQVGFKEKSIRSGRGKMRGRKYKTTAGLLLVVGKNEKIKMKVVDIAHADALNVVDLAKGGPGRLTIYTENAIKEIQERMK